MISVSLTRLHQILGGTLIGADCEILSVSTDTRTLEEGALFVALVGDNFDGHAFGQQAKALGAAALLVDKPLDISLPQLIVKDTRKALGQLGAWVHQQSDIKTLAITGSCGKTTVKEMTAAILSLKGKVLATAGNFNNDIGVPLTLLRSEPDHDYAVIELGANHANEIAYTTGLVKPSVALVNNVAAAHLEGFGSIDGVKKAKGEIYQGLEEDGVAIVNMESNGGKYWEQVLSGKKVVTFSDRNPQASYHASNIQLDSLGYAHFELHTPVGQANIKLSLIGKHNVANALAASALAIECGASLTDVSSGLANVTNAKGRVEVNRLNTHLTLIDDSYNASVPAMKAAVDLLSTYQGTRWLVLGFMAELGKESLELHRQLGDYAAQFNFEHVLTFGDQTKIISDICNGLNFSTHLELIDYMESKLLLTPKENHTVLIKGANSARMSVVADALKEKHQ